MDETQVNKLGIKPAQPLLDEVRAIKTKADVQHMIGQLHDLGIAVPFGVFAQPGPARPDQMIAHVVPAASACRTATTT